MDISGPVRALLQRHVPAEAGDVFGFTARLLAHPEERTGALPAMGAAAGPVGEVAAPEDRLKAGLQGGQAGRRAHDLLGQSLLLRALPRVSRGVREDLAARLTEALRNYFEDTKRLLVSRTAPPVELLWRYWLAALARDRLKMPVEAMQLRILWQNAWVRQAPDGGLHRPAADAALDGATYDDLVALHVAYNAVLLTRDYDQFPPVQKLADFLVQTAQPDHTTAEPWGVAAFAALDGTGTFAPQQVHDATVQLSTAGAQPAILGLLADALMAQDEAADA